MNNSQYISLDQLKKISKDISKAPTADKRDWILSHAKGKEVLDLGIVGYDNNGKGFRSSNWLHGHLKKVASSLTGVDLIEKELTQLQEAGYDVVCADAQTVRLDKKYDVVVCGDLIEHVVNPGNLIETIGYHLKEDGIGIITTPNPFSIGRAFQLFVRKWPWVSVEHVSWFCPQTMIQLVNRYPLEVKNIYWLKTDFPMRISYKSLGAIFNLFIPLLNHFRKGFKDDFGVIIYKRSA